MCRRCPRDQESATEFGGNCVCKRGYWLVNGNCRGCPAETISRPFGIPIFIRKCTKCPPGRFFATAGGVGLHGSCRFCPLNSTTPPSGGAAACKLSFSPNYDVSFLLVHVYFFSFKKKIIGDAVIFRSTYTFLFNQFFFLVM